MASFALAQDHVSEVLCFPHSCDPSHLHTCTDNPKAEHQHVLDVLSGILERYIEVWFSLWLLFFFFFFYFEICIQCKCLTLLTLGLQMELWLCVLFSLPPHTTSSQCCLSSLGDLAFKHNGETPCSIIGPVAGVTCPSFLRVLHVLRLPFRLSEAFLEKERSPAERSLEVLNLNFSGNSRSK